MSPFLELFNLVRNFRIPIEFLRWTGEGEARGNPAMALIESVQAKGQAEVMWVPAKSGSWVYCVMATRGTNECSSKTLRVGR